MNEPSHGDVFAPGDTLVGRYRIVRRLGHGGMAYVYEGEHLRLRRPVAIKVLRREMTSPQDVARFEREGRALATMKSPYVTRVIDVDTTANGAVLLVMELLLGLPLDEEIARRGPLPIGEATRFIAQACEGLSEAHALGIVHRDIKPSNLFLASEAGARIVKVIDFGISKAPLVEDAKLTRTEHMIGTPLYMAPEQFAAPGEVDARADVWSLGCTLFELLTGKAPYEGSSATVAYTIASGPPPRIETLRADIPASLSSVIARALERERDARFSSANEFKAALAPFVGGEESTKVVSVSFDMGDHHVKAEAPTQRADVQSTMSTVKGAAAISHLDPAETTRETRDAARSPRGVVVAGIAAMVLLVVVALFAGWRTVTRAGANRATSEDASPTANVAPIATVAPTPNATPAPAPNATPAPAPNATPTPLASAAPRSSGATSGARRPRPVGSSTPSAATPPSHPPIFFPQ